MRRELQPVPGVREHDDSLAVMAPQPAHFSTALMLQVHLHRWWGAFRKGWWILALSVLLVGGAAGSYAFLKRPTFRSVVTLWLTPKLSFPGDQKLFSEDLVSFIGTQAELIENGAVQMKAYEKIRASFPELEAKGPITEIELLPFAVSTKTSTKTSVLEVEAKGPSGPATKAFLDALVQEYFVMKKQSRQQASTGALTSITDQMKELEQQLQKQELAIKSFGMSNNVSHLMEQSSSAGTHLSRISEQLMAMRTEYKILESLTPEQIARGGNDRSLLETPLVSDRSRRALSGAAEGPEHAYLQVLQQLELFKSTRERFAQVLRPTHSKMIKLDNEIAGLEQLIKKLKEEGAMQALAQVVGLKKSLQLQIENLENQYYTWQTNAGMASRVLLEFERLKQERQRSQSLYDSMATLLQTVDVHNNSEQEPLNLLAPASAPRPANRRTLILAAGLLLGFVLGSGGIFLVEFFNDRFTSYAELSNAIPETVLGQIPESHLHSHGSGGSNRQDPEMQHAFSEAFRSLGLSLLFSFDDANKPRTVLVTSAVPAEGKSTVASNLAASMAQSGARVLLIDADLRRSSLHQIFGTPLKPGMREVLGKSATLNESIVQVDLQQFESAVGSASNPNLAGNLFLLPAGESGIGAAEAFLSTELDEVMSEAAAQFDYVIIDTPPVLATSDIMSVVPKADYVLMVLRASYTSSRMVREALNRLYRCNVKALGVVYNRASASTDYFYRYSRDYYSKADTGVTPVLEPDVVFPAKRTRS